MTPLEKADLAKATRAESRHALADLLSHRGWHLVCEEIRRNQAEIVADLLTVDPRDAVRVTALQETHSTLAGVLESPRLLLDWYADPREGPPEEEEQGEPEEGPLPL